MERISTPYFQPSLRHQTTTPNKCTYIMSDELPWSTSMRWISNPTIRTNFMFHALSGHCGLIFPLHTKLVRIYCSTTHTRYKNYLDIEVATTTLSFSILFSFLATTTLSVCLVHQHTCSCSLKQQLENLTT